MAEGIPNPEAEAYDALIERSSRVAPERVGVERAESVFLEGKILGELQRVKIEEGAIAQSDLLDRLTKDASFNNLLPTQQLERVLGDMAVIRQNALTRQYSQDEVTSAMRQVLFSEQNIHEQQARARDPNFEPIRIRSMYGERMVYWPKEIGDKWILMRDVLGKLEASEEPDGGLGLSQTVNEVAMVIEALRSSRDQDKSDLGREMYKEFMARYVFHQKYLAFKNAPDMNTQVQARLSLRGEFLKTVKDIQSNGTRVVGKSFNELEKRAEPFLEADMVRRQEIRREMVDDNDLGLRLVQDTDQFTPDGKYWWLHDPDQLSYVRLAERLWEFTARSVIRDRVIQDDIDPSKKRFRNTIINSGNFNDRRVMRFKDWVSTAPLYTNAHTELLDGIEGQVLGAVDWISDMVLPHYEQYFREAFEQNKDRVAARNTAIEELNKTFKGIKDLIEIDKKGNAVLPKVLEDQIEIDWERFNPTVSAEAPMVHMAWYGNHYPEGARGKLISESLDTFLMIPSFETILKFKETFLYMGGGMFDFLAILTSNFVKLGMSEKAWEAGLIRFDRQIADINIFRLSHEFGLDIERYAKIVEERLGKGVGAGLLLGLSYFKVHQGFVYFIMEILKGIAKESFSPKALAGAA